MTDQISSPIKVAPNRYSATGLSLGLGLGLGRGNTHADLSLTSGSQLFAPKVGADLPLGCRGCPPHLVVSSTSVEK
jgi:hypothetical protein